jgi:CheY-like chemotaxis protein
MSARYRITLRSRFSHTAHRRILFDMAMQLLDDIAEPTYAANADRSVLIVEADPMQSSEMRQQLRNWQVRNPIRRVATVAGLTMYMQGHGVYGDRDRFTYPAVILLSTALPNLDSARAQAWIRSSLTHRKLPMVVTGSTRQVPIMEAAVRLGANAYMTTPFDAREFHCLCRVLRLPVVFGVSAPTVTHAVA